jgi:antitoxin (DNA-binding transcriptional repressor) of toxin-antitoxin stability system
VEFVTVAELHDQTADVLDRVRNGSEVMITEGGMVIATMIAVHPAKKAFLTTADLLALRPTTPDLTLRADISTLTSDTTDDLGAIQ